MAENSGENEVKIQRQGGGKWENIEGKQNVQRSAG